ncbi:MAG TPA: hypothetical protein VMY43_04195 [Methanothrix sp.]|nr:hypothetical protein [Methanothrix sp.]
MKMCPGDSCSGSNVAARACLLSPGMRASRASLFARIPGGQPGRPSGTPAAPAAPRRPLSSFQLALAVKMHLGGAETRLLIIILFFSSTESLPPLPANYYSQKY